MLTRDDVATTPFHREPPLPVRPTLLAAEPPRPARIPTPRLPFPQLPRPGSVCTTCPFRQLPDPPLPPTATRLRPPTEPRHAAPANVTAIQPHPPTPSDTATQLLPPTGTGMTTVIQVAPPPPTRRPAPPPRRSPVAALQLGLWLVIAFGLLLLAFRT